ncbi:hypothetical protein J6590_035512 [Homalodisca vitripennis]|nr:hypothetical protein J6590_035512 [Homalodisca vitripennis]
MRLPECVGGVVNVRAQYFRHLGWIDVKHRAVFSRILVGRIVLSETSHPYLHLLLGHYLNELCQVTGDTPYTTFHSQHPSVSTILLLQLTAFFGCDGSCQCISCCSPSS